MARTLVDFEGEMIDVMSIFHIKKKEKWNETWGRIDFCIIINPNFDDKFTIKELIFSYERSDLRDKAMSQLKEKIGGIEHVIIL